MEFLLFIGIPVALLLAARIFLWPSVDYAALTDFPPVSSARRRVARRAVVYLIGGPASLLFCHGVFVVLLSFLVPERQLQLEYVVFSLGVGGLGLWLWWWLTRMILKADKEDQETRGNLRAD